MSKTIPAVEPRKLMTFKQFLLSDKSNGSAARREANRVRSAIKRKLGEAADVDSDVASSIFAAIEAKSSDREATLQLLTNEIRKMSEKMDVAVSCVPLR